MLRVSRQTLAAEIQKKRIASTKIGREYRILQSEILRFLGTQEDHQVEPAVSVALIGTETLNVLEDFLLKGGVPSHHVLFEFDLFCNAVVCHDEVRVIADESDLGNNPLIEAFSSFVKPRRFTDLVPETVESRLAEEFENQLRRVLGNNCPYVSQDAVLSRGITDRKRAAGALQEQLNGIVCTDSDLQTARARIRKLLLAWLDQPTRSFSPELHYYLRALLYNSIAISSGWTYLPNLERSALFSIYNIPLARLPILESMEQLVPPIPLSPLRSPIGYVCMDSANLPNAIHRILQSWRDRFSIVREEFLHLNEEIESSTTLAARHKNWTNFQESLVVAFQNMDWSVSSRVEKMITDLVKSFLYTIGSARCGPP